MTGRIPDDELAEIIEADRLLRYEAAKLSKAQRHRRRLLEELLELRRENHRLLNAPRTDQGEPDA